MKRSEAITILNDKINSCTQCALCKMRNHPVPGSGSLTAGIMFIGEGPGKNEDEKGLPFVGRAGSLLDELLESIGLKREDIFITNIVKCRPPKNRDPENEEMKLCSKYLDLQIEIIKPRVIATLGRFAMQYIFDKYDCPCSTISEMAGQVFHLPNGNTPKPCPSVLVPLFHPCVAIYNSSKKDLLKKHFQTLTKLD